MVTTIDKAGRIIVPKEFRDEQFLKQASLLQIQGGNIHDFYHYSVAQKMKVNALFTWNTKDFLQFGTELLIQTP